MYEDQGKVMGMVGAELSKFLNNIISISGENIMPTILP